MQAYGLYQLPYRISSGVSFPESDEAKELLQGDAVVPDVMASRSRAKHIVPRIMNAQTFYLITREERYIMDTKTVQKLEAYMKRKGFVSAAYIFGSHADGKAGPLSDIDIAVLFKNDMSKRDMDEKKTILASEIPSIICTDDFDLIVMNHAPLLMKFNIIRSGRVLKTSRERVPMEFRTISDFLDRKHFEEMYASSTIDRVADEGIL